MADEPDGVGRKLGAVEPDGEVESIDLTATDGKRVATGVNDGYCGEVGPSDGFELGFTRGVGIGVL